ncbi:hypothetical protein CHS0354_038498 [Potamilus streckersoni]|uniref:Uncharacterized protein n=1 Tax=Potamilus streckersoni TaxID=2493646 RepID=A0AAE0S608_9BIVA|nr:hypothetical protein CHS0354_038498 [Potamilus streckersoni]
MRFKFITRQMTPLGMAGFGLGTLYVIYIAYAWVCTREQLKTLTLEVEENDDHQFVDFGETKPDHITFDAAIEQYEADFKEIFKHAPDDKKFLIYDCRYHCGGWGDRIKGMVTAYLLSILSNRTFGIQHSYPCGLSNYLAPNLINWQIEDSRLTSPSVHTIDYMNDHIEIQGRIQHTNFIEYKHDVIYLNVNQDWTDQLKKNRIARNVLSPLQKKTYSDIFRIVYFGLFKYSDVLRNKIKDFVSEYVGYNKLACFHARIDHPGNERYETTDFGSVWSLLRRFNLTKRYKIFVASDNTEIKMIASALFGNNYIARYWNVGHVDEASSCEDLLVTLTEHSILMRCDVLVLTASGFSYQAAHFRQTSRNLFCFFRAHGVYPCKRELIKYLYGWPCGMKDQFCY